MSSSDRPVSPARRAGFAAEEAAISPWAQFLARAGYATRGIVYVLIGAIAVRAAIGAGGSPTDQKGALLTLYREPFGRILLVLVAIGLTGYAFWHLVRAVFDPEHNGASLKGLVTRAAYAGVCVSYGALAAGVIRLLTGSGGVGKSSDASTQDWTARLLDKPFGVGLVVAVGAGVLITAAVLLIQAWTAKFARHLDLVAARQKRGIVVALGRAGYASLGFVFSVVGLFLIVAALRHDPHQAHGVGQSLVLLAQQPFGPILLLAVALGLVAYGIYSFAEARYHRIQG